MEIDQLRIFARVADLGSFTHAAEQLGLTKGRVSTVVQRLESDLGVRLLHRTTRHVRLTPDGEQFIERCKDLIADAEQLGTMFQPAATGARGRVRIDLSHALARDLVIPRLPEFLAAHPLLEIGLSTTDRRVDLVQEGFDCVLRIGRIADSSLVARPLGVMKMRNLASPAYLQTFGTPTALADLAQHRIVHYASTLSTQGAGWEYVDGGATRTQPMRSVIVVNGTDAYQAACLAGLGMIQVPAYGTQQLVASGRLVDVMPAFTAASMPVSLLYPNRRQMASGVQAILNWITQVVQPTLEAADERIGRARRRTSKRAGAGTSPRPRR